MAHRFPINQWTPWAWLEIARLYRRQGNPPETGLPELQAALEQMKKQPALADGVQQLETCVTALTRWTTEPLQVEPDALTLSAPDPDALTIGRLSVRTYQAADIRASVEAPFLSVEVGEAKEGRDSVERGITVSLVKGAMPSPPPGAGAGGSG